jgi:NADPH:quinone reductase-like Zn-dependent oxidoreductase
VLGADVAGVVETLGDGVSAFQPGDAVFGDLSGGKWGGFAEFAVAKPTELARIPAGLGFIGAAAIPQAGALALQGLRRRSGLGAGTTILINGAGGGVGTFAVQLAKSFGTTVTAVDRGEKGKALLALGADRFVDYHAADFAAEGTRYDLILDVVARHSVWQFAGALNDGGHLVVIGGRIPSLLQVAALGGLVGRGAGPEARAAALSAVGGGQSRAGTALRRRHAAAGDRRGLPAGARRRGAGAARQRTGGGQGGGERRELIRAGAGHNRLLSGW